MTRDDVEELVREGDGDCDAVTGDRVLVGVKDAVGVCELVADGTAEALESTTTDAWSTRNV